MAASAAFIQFARQARLIEGALVAIDGSKVRAMASKKALGRKVDLQRSHQAITEEVTDYWSRLKKADQDEGGEATNRSAVQAALTRLQQRQGYLHDEIERIENSRSTLSVQGEPQALSMKSLHVARGYNLQSAVDATAI